MTDVLDKKRNKLFSFSWVFDLSEKLYAEFYRKNKKFFDEIQ